MLCRQAAVNDAKVSIFMTASKFSVC